MKQIAITASIYVVMVIVVWIGADAFADTVKSHEIIHPKDGIECVVVSRSFNTSVDCWKR